MITYQITVVCDHFGRDASRRKVISRLNWTDDDPEFVAALSQDINGETVTEDDVRKLLLNDRFRIYEEWSSKTGRSRRLANPELDYGTDDVAERAGAWGGWRFKCRCGVDRPMRQDRLDRWIRQQIEAAPTRRVFEFEISR